MLAVAMLLAPLVPALVLQPFVRPTSTLRRPSTRAASCLPAMAAIADETQVKEMRWVTGSGRVEPWATVIENIVEDCRHKKDVQVHVGCDSAIQQGKRIVFAIVVCVIQPGNAGRYYYSRHCEARTLYPVLQTRLLREVQLSLEVAEELQAEGVTVKQVHCDSNTDPSCKSTEHTKLLTGYVQSMGYQCLAKPHAWATFIADRHSRSVAHPNRMPARTGAPASSGHTSGEKARSRPRAR